MQSTNVKKLVLDTLIKSVSEYFPGEPRRLGVAYSGGQDSTVLLWAACQCFGSERVVALWVDHGFRPLSERQQEQGLVRSLCDQLGVQLITFGPPPHELVGAGPEDAFRRFRLSCLEKAAQTEDLDGILTAHHAGDQVETILMRLFQGRSWDGLVGISPRRGVFLRPFLALSREIIAKTASAVGLSWHDDSTNTNLDFRRNYLRNAVLPVIRSDFPQVDRAIQDFAQHWKALHDAPSQPDTAWKISKAEATLALEVWQSWPAHQKETQLLTVFRLLHFSDLPNVRLSRRFLETVTTVVPPRWRKSGHWEFGVQGKIIFWRRIVEVTSLGYHLVAQFNRVYDLKAYTVMFFHEFCPGAIWLRGSDPERSLVWKSLNAGEAWKLSDGQVTDKKWRKHHPGSAGLFQGGALLAVLDLNSPELLTEVGALGLIKRGIFVKLTLRSV